jgi:hypothetical protein
MGVYSDVAGVPSALLGVTPSTAVRTTAGWQTIFLTTPVSVASGQKVWLVWTFQNAPNTKFTSTSPVGASVTSSYRWADGLPLTVNSGAFFPTNLEWSVYLNYIPNTPPPPVSDTTKPVVTAFTIPSTATSLTVSVSSFTATDNIGVSGYKITESATAPLSGDAGWSST